MASQWLRSASFDFLRLRLAAHGFALARRRSPSVVGSRQPLAVARLLFDFFSAWAIVGLFSVVMAFFLIVVTEID